MKIKKQTKKIKELLQIASQYYSSGQLQEAEHLYRKILRKQSNNAIAYNNLGNILQQKGELDEAIVCYQKASQFSPDCADAFYNLGSAFHHKRNLENAIVHYRKALALKPTPLAYNNMGSALQEQDQLEEAIACYHNAIALDPNYSNAYSNLGVVLRDTGQVDEAFVCFQKALQHNSGNPGANWNIALLLLMQGNFKEGWQRYEWRWKVKGFQKRNFPQPAWDGTDLKGKTILIYSEQGIGDEIMFASCIPELISGSSLCVLECDRRLVPLFSRSFPSITVQERIGDSVPSPEMFSTADTKVAIGSLPLFLRPSLSRFPQQYSYLIPDDRKVSLWRNRYSELGEGLKAGISWRGGKIPSVQRERSMALEQWSKLFSINGAFFINLQYGDTTMEIRQAEEKFGISIHAWEDADPLKDLDGFAAQIAALDLVISVDNSTVHMAGALGVPVYALLPFTSDWRWMREFEDTPWYKTVRLFRQRIPGDWAGVLEQVHRSVSEAVQNSHVSMEDWRTSLTNSYLKTLDK